MSYENTEKYSEVKNYIKRCSRQLLFSDWINQILAFSVVFGMYYAFLQFGSAVSILAERMTANEAVSSMMFVLYLTLSFAFMIPLIYGLLQFEVNSLENDKSDLKDLFTAFSSPQLLERAYKLFGYTAIRAVFAFLPAMVLMFFSENVYYAGYFGEGVSFENVDLVFFAIQTLTVILLFFGVIYSFKPFAGIYVSLVRSEDSIKECFYVGAVCTGIRTGWMCRLVFSFLPLCVLSLFTAGFLFIIYTLPYMLISVTVLSKYFYQNEMLSRNAVDRLYKSEENQIENEIENNED